MPPRRAGDNSSKADHESLSFGIAQYRFCSQRLYTAAAAVMLDFQWKAIYNLEQQIHIAGGTIMIGHSRTQKKRYTISVGLNDKDDYIQKFQTERIINLVTNCCKAYELPFSCYPQNGGYKCENGRYILEKSIAIILIDPTEQLVEELSKDLCAFLNQETVLVTVENIECFLISQTISD